MNTERSNLSMKMKQNGVQDDNMSSIQAYNVTQSNLHSHHTWKKILKLQRTSLIRYQTFQQPRHDMIKEICNTLFGVQDDNSASSYMMFHVVFPYSSQQTYIEVM